MCRAMTGALLLALAGSAWAANVNVDVNLDRRLVHPEIYGMNFGTAAQMSALKVPLRRWGGNSVTRYNWQVRVNNTANDYFFMNIPPSIGQMDADQFVNETRAAGGQPLITIPTIGWTARADTPEQKKWGFSVTKYGVQLSNERSIYPPTPDYDWAQADAGDGNCDTAVNLKINPNNGQRYCQGGVIVGNDPLDTSTAAPPSFEAAWIAHLQAQFGTAASGGLRYYALDNEPMLWNSTHRDVHPVAPDYDEIWNKAVAYAAAIKQQDAAAQVLGPVTWGYCDLFSSAADGCHVGADRNAHGGTPFVAWYLQQVCANPLPGGKRLVDVLDLHYYPQDPNGSATHLYSEDEDGPTQARRLASLKELYDPAWPSNSWISDLADGSGYNYDKPNLLPRVRAWIDQYCPGTRVAITEYNWGGLSQDWNANSDQGVSAALAQAEALAIFGREGVALATRWVAPKVGTAVETAFKLFLNYDGTFARVVGYSTRATSSAVDTVGAYAVDLPRQRTMLLLFNKSTSAQPLTLTLAQHYTGTWKLYRFADDGSSPAGYGVTALAQVATGSLSNAQTVSHVQLNTLPARSASLLVLPAPGDSDVIFVDGFDG